MSEAKIGEAAPVAWVHEEDSDRVISATQKATAIRDGGASATSVKAYSVAAYLHPQPAELAEQQGDARAQFEVVAKRLNISLLTWGGEWKYISTINAYQMFQEGWQAALVTKENSNGNR